MPPHKSLLARGAIASLAVVATALPLSASLGPAVASPVAGVKTVALPAATSALTTAPEGSMPDSTNTGVPAGTTLRQHTGDIVVTKAGTVLDRLDVHGFVIVKAPNVTIRRSIIRGGVATGNIGLVTNTTPSAENLFITDSELYPEHPSVWIDGIKGGNFTAQRVNVHGTVDAVKVHGNNVTVVGSYLHDTRYFAHDPNQRGGPTHNDGVQVLGGNNVLVQHNSIAGGSNSALQVTQDYARVSNMAFNDNDVNGGACTVNIAQKPLNDVTVTVAGNRFGPDRVYKGCGIIASPDATLLGSGNVWSSDATQTLVRRAG